MENKKVFIDGMFSSIWVQYILVFVFLLFPILRLLIDFAFHPHRINVYNFLIIIITVLFIGIVAFRYAIIFKIETDSRGVSYYGFLKKVSASWKEIISINQSLNLNFGKVKTKNGNFYFSLMMKEQNKTYPKLRIGFPNYKWIYENGIKKKMIIENCPLYIEMLKHYAQGRTSKIYRSHEIFTALFLIVPLSLLIQSGLIYLLIKNWIRNDFNVVLFLAIMSFILIGFVVFILILFRKYSTFEIVTDEKGIAFYGLFKKIYARWQDVISISKGSPFMRERVALVKTRNGNFYFPLSIGGDPKLDIEVQFPQKPITPENCPLFLEIQQHLGNK